MMSESWEEAAQRLAYHLMKQEMIEVRMAFSDLIDDLEAGGPPTQEHVEQLQYALDEAGGSLLLVASALPETERTW